MNNDICLIIIKEDTFIGGEQFGPPGNTGAIYSVSGIANMLLNFYEQYTVEVELDVKKSV
jgi:hypothetical protein